MLVLQLVELFCEAVEPSGSLLLGVGLWKGPGLGPGFGLSLSACWSAVLGEASMAWPRWLFQCWKALWSSLKLSEAPWKLSEVVSPNDSFPRNSHFDTVVQKSLIQRKVQELQDLNDPQINCQESWSKQNCSTQCFSNFLIFFLMVICYFHSYFRGQLR